MNPYYLPNYLKHSEDLCLFNCLSSLDADGFQYEFDRMMIIEYHNNQQYVY